MSVPASFPAAYVDSFMEFLASPESGVTVLTYADLDFGDDWNYAENYPEERKRWLASLTSGERDPNQIYVFLQHDVDSSPERTTRLLGVQHRLGVRSCVMIHNRLINRGALQTNGVVEYADYPIDRQQLAELDKQGWVIGYHSNAFERGGLDMSAGERAFVDDVEELRREFRVEFFCPHGGVRDAQGRSNVDLGLPDSMATSLRWTLNRHTIKFDGVFTDGRWATRRDTPDKLNLAEFARSWKPGKRYRLLLHPQYYGDPSVAHGAWLDVDWYSAISRPGQDAESFRDLWSTPLSKVSP